MFKSVTYGRSLRFSYVSWIKKIALIFDIKGKAFVQEDGSVKVIAEGEEKKLIKFIRRLRKGRFFIGMDDFCVRWRMYTGEYQDFSIPQEK